MNGRKFLLSLSFCLFSAISSIGHADIRIDLTPEKVVIAKTLVDDVSMTYAQSVYVYVKNVGNRPLKAINAQVKINGVVYDGLLYGPDNRGGSLGGPIEVGETGKIIVSRPVGSYHHCQGLQIHIDPRRRLQAATSGADVFANDSKSLIAFEYGNIRPCFIRPPRVDTFL